MSLFCDMTALHHDGPAKDGVTGLVSAIVARIKQLQPAVSNRQIARTLGVDPQTVNNDVAENSAPNQRKPREIKAPKSDGAENSAPALSGREAAAAVNRRE
jgi:hypothetical protein